MYLALCVVLACGHPRPAPVPGSTLRTVASVSIRAADGGEPDMDVKVLLGKLAHRTGNVAIPRRDYNPYRIGEDRRRIATFAGNYGYFDAKVPEPSLTEKGSQVTIDWRVDMGAKYRIGSLALIGVPAEAKDTVMAAIPFRSGSDVAVNESRILRHKLADAIRRFGYAHARVYSRTWVDREKKSVEWFYFVDPGPRTTIASIRVVGNNRVSREAILERSGLKVGGSYSPRERDRAQLSLMDAASMNSVVVEADEDIHRGPPEIPDSGGKPITDAQGEMVPRALASELNILVTVVEAPRRELRLEMGAEADPSRTDVYAGGRTVFRDVATDALHVVLDGRVGYGYQLGDSSEPLGMYGHALAQVVKAGAFGSRFDLRASGSLQQRLFPDTSVREYSAGPGLRRTLVDNMHLDLEATAFAAEEVEPLALSAGQRDALKLAGDSTSHGFKLTSRLVHDVRDSGVEAMNGHFASALVEFAPDMLGASHQWLKLAGDVRYFHPLAPNWSLAARGSASWVLAAGDQGLPLQSRLFGGGSYGFRGYGRQAFSPDIDGVLVGGTSLVESSLELRNLPLQKLFGLIGFLDAGAVASENNPFADGVSSAVGVGARLRLFYIPIAFDLSYRFVDRSKFEAPIAWDPWSLFVRLGEAF